MEDFTDADGLEDLVFTFVHVLEVFECMVVVSEEVEDAVNSVEEDFGACVVIMLLGVACGLVDIDDDVAFEGIGFIFTHIESKYVGWAGDVHELEMELSHAIVGDDVDAKQTGIDIGGGEGFDDERLKPIVCGGIGIGSFTRDVKLDA
ncbi:hypothetical protein KS4_21690 [Poriferisphaera corsica]|uniref:Uncharacterized protein n=1 Tax=Poriferisphaera corsica TaxID=2528020 RepID=A0A517YV59_9BACT|nr:hypothetical protein KS4_21690 [Poriferisphaera corsica]